MILEARVTFRDKGEAARWLAAYTSRRYQLPAAVNAAFNAEFPMHLASDAGVTSQAIERAALARLARPTIIGEEDYT